MSSNTGVLGSHLNTNFITRQLKDQLPAAARSILAWASLLGNTFSFTVIQRLMSGEFDYTEDGDGDNTMKCDAAADLFTTKSEESAVEGLQACLQTSILVSGEDDDQFRSVRSESRVSMETDNVVLVLAMSGINKLPMPCESATM